MPQSEYDLKKPGEFSTGLFLRTLLVFLLLDVVVYANVVPLVSAYLVGCAVKIMGLNATWELLLTLALTFVLLYLAFQLCGEASYWKHLFAFDRTYYRLLQLRDVINIGIMVCTLIELQSTIYGMITVDQGIKPEYLGEGSSYFAFKRFFRLLRFEGTEQKLGLKLPHAGGLTDPNFGENEKYERGGAYIFLWAALASCVTKLLYYNTLFTYIRAMEIFISLKPTFDDDDYDSISDYRSIRSRSLMYRKERSNQNSQMDNDYARAARNANWDD